MKLAIVLSTHAAKFQAVTFKGDFEENVARIASYGYNGVELHIRDPKLVDGDELEAVVKEHGLEVPAIGTGQAWGEEHLSFTSDDPAIRRAAIERIKSHVALAGRFSAVIILGLIRGITPRGQSHEQSMAYLVDALQECSATVPDPAPVSPGPRGEARAGGIGKGRAADQRVRFALEPLNRYETDLIHTVEDGMDLVRRVGAENFGLLLDTFHMNIEEPSIEESIRACGDHIFHFHVADSNRWHPGAGHLDFSRILAALRETGYAGYVSGEFMPLPDAQTGAQRAIEHLRCVA